MFRHWWHRVRWCEYQKSCSCGIFVFSGSAWSWFLTISILWWIAAGFVWHYDLVDLKCQFIMGSKTYIAIWQALSLYKGSVAARAAVQKKNVVYAIEDGVLLQNIKDLSTLVLYWHFPETLYLCLLWINIFTMDTGSAMDSVDYIVWRVRQLAVLPGFAVEPSFCSERHWNCETSKLPQK